MIINLDLSQFDPGLVSLTITANSTEGDIASAFFVFTVPEPLGKWCCSRCVLMCGMDWLEVYHCIHNVL